MSLAPNAREAPTSLRRDVLPEGDEIARMRLLPEDKRPTFEDIGRRYGVSRQAVHRRLKKWVSRNPTHDLAVKVREAE